jgi:eukaryotic-like serine/threonine-protein kinase
MSPENSAERWKQIKEIFDEAVELPSVERAQYLESVCQGDLDLREAVEKMLVIDDESSTFLEESPLEILEKSNQEELTNQHLGSYKLLKEIGRGGMGAVFLAERNDKEFEKKVAIKIVKRGMDTDDILRRFRHERQILASLEHPNIARMIDGGTTKDGLPYFVMEYIEGADIISYSDSNSLTINERLKLFGEVCKAVQFAHQNLIIHRDLKPSNIIISQNGTPKLLDFGISKILNSTDEKGTVTSLGIMTPAYASPEQANGKNVTTGTDVYSLGVVLYELLTGQMPYQFV